MNNNKDLYSILGVNKDVSDKDLKSAYRKLAKTWHPDKFGDKSDKEKKEAEEKFKEITEAYNVLSDKDKRKQYDMFGTTDGQSYGGNWGGTSADDIFSQFMHNSGFSHFGGFGGGRNTQPSGSDKKIRISVTLEDVYFERYKEVSYEVERSCDECGGSGSRSGVNGQCPYCHGTGFITKTQHFMGGYSQQSSPCPHCHGTGYYIQDPCSHCHGTGVKAEKVKRSFKVPSIDKLGLTYKIGQEGNSAHNNNGVNGDLYFAFALKEDPNSEFHIDTNDYSNICMSIDVSVIDCLTGCDKEITTIDEKKLRIHIPQGTKDGYKMTFKNYGFKLSNGMVGNLIVTVRMTMPKLTNEQINKIKEIVEEK